MNYLRDSFSVMSPGGDFAEKHERIFGKQERKEFAVCERCDSVVEVGSNHECNRKENENG